MMPEMNTSVTVPAVHCTQRPELYPQRAHAHRLRPEPCFPGLKRALRGGKETAVSH